MALRRPGDRLNPRGANQVSPGWWLVVALVILGAAASACYDNNTGRTNIGGSVNFKLPAFPETGSNAVQVFTEMHYQPSYRAQEAPRLLPPPESVPVSGKELTYSKLEDYQKLVIPAAAIASYDAAKAERLYVVNCLVCHGKLLKGDGRILDFMKRGPFPADLTADATKGSNDGELFAFISRGGSQGLAARLRGRESSSPMPEFQRLLTEEERWALVQYLRSKIGR